MLSSNGSQWLLYGNKYGNMICRCVPFAVHAINFSNENLTFYNATLVFARMG